MPREFVVVLLLFTLSPSAFAWNKSGHMVTGAIAHRVLKASDEPTIARVVAILEQHPAYPRWQKAMPKFTPEDREIYLFMQAARWPDDARDDPAFYPPDARYDQIHYVNFPYKPANQPASVEMGQPETNSILRGFADKKKLVQQSSDAKERAVALCWVFHLIGDVHQPLHTTSLFTTQFQREAGRLTGDRGGTRFYIRAKDGAFPISLHKFWDDLLLGSESFQNVRNLATELRLRKEFSKEKLTELANTDFEHWASKESFPLAKEHAYRNGTLKGSPQMKQAPTLPADYAKATQPIAERRAVLAGYRIAAVLREAVGKGSK